jgi:Na+-transporting methylmalonyl-CoA/oxaloacetate decarboxylase gamma subunit
MDIWSFGWTLSVIGMAGTMLVLWCLSLLILLLRKIFPYKPEATAPKKGSTA